jgi:transcriptional regulator with XRE-family HTH domain
LSIIIEQMIVALVKRRNDLGYSQRELDKLVGVSDCMIAKWEAHHRSPTAESLEKWAAALGLRLELKATDSRPPKRKRAA